MRRHETTKNGIGVKIRDPYRYRSAPPVIFPFYRERERTRFFRKIYRKYTKTKKKKMRMYIFWKLLKRASIKLRFIIDTIFIFITKRRNDSESIEEFANSKCSYHLASKNSALRTLLDYPFFPQPQGILFAPQGCIHLRESCAILRATSDQSLIRQIPARGNIFKRTVSIGNRTSSFSIPRFIFFFSRSEGGVLCLDIIIRGGDNDRTQQ